MQMPRRGQLRLLLLVAMLVTSTMVGPSSSTLANEEATPVPEPPVVEVVDLPEGSEESAPAAAGDEGARATPQPAADDIDLADATPLVTFDPVSARPGETVTVTLAGFPALEEAWIEFADIDGNFDFADLGNTDSTGSLIASWSISMSIWFPVRVRTSGDISVSVDESFTVLPLLVVPDDLERGGEGRVTLTGVRFHQNYLLQWWINGSWVSIAKGVQTSESPSAWEFLFNVPRRATNGTNEIRVFDAPSTVIASASVEVTGVAGSSQLELSTSVSRATVGMTIMLDVSGAEPDSMLNVTWRRPGGSTVLIDSQRADGSGMASIPVTIPNTEGGPENRIIVEAATGSGSITIEVAPRVWIYPGAASPGDSVGITLRGYGKHEVVRIRWLVDGSWVELTSVETTNLGVASVLVEVPGTSPGPAKVRGDGTTFRQQTNAFTVLGD